MSRNILYLLSISLVFTISCQNKGDEKTIVAAKPTIIHLHDTNKVAELKLKDVFEITDITPLETDTIKSILASTNDIIYIENRYFVLDTKLSVLKVFDQKGNFLYNIGKLGAGPGEYSRIFSVAYTQNTNEVIFYCLNDMKMIWYGLGGNYIKQERIPFFTYYFTQLPGDNYAFYCNYNTSEYNQNHNLLITDPNFKILHRYFPYKRDFAVSTAGFLKKTCTGILYSDAYSNRVYKIDDKQITPTYDFDLGKDSVTQDVSTKFEVLVKHLMGRTYLKRISADDQSMMSFTYIEKQYVLQGFFDKRKQQLYTKTNFSENDLFHLLGIGGIQGNPLQCGEYLVLIEPDIFFSRTEANPNFMPSLKKDYPQVYEKFKNFRETDNPIVLRMKLNEQLK